MKKKLLITIVGVLAVNVMMGCSDNKSKSNTTTATDIESVYTEDTKNLSDNDEPDSRLKESEAKILLDNINNVMKNYDSDVATESVEGSVPDMIDINIENGKIVDITDIDEELKSRIQDVLGDEYVDYEEINISVRKEGEAEFDITVTIDGITVNN